MYGKRNQGQRQKNEKGVRLGEALVFVGDRVSAERPGPEYPLNSS